MSINMPQLIFQRAESAPLSGGQSISSLGDKLGAGPLFLIRWGLSTRDKLGDGSFVPYTVEPLYKGQVGDRSFVSYTVHGASLQGTSWGRVLCPL